MQCDRNKNNNNKKKKGKDRMGEWGGGTAVFLEGGKQRDKTCIFFHV